jgi:hypothetical protein
MKVIGVPDDRDHRSGIAVISSRSEAGSWILQKVITPGGSPARGNPARVDLLYDRLTEVLQ